MDRKPPEPKPFIIPIFLPHTGCRHRCSFCDQATITGQGAALPRPGDIRREIQTFLRYKKAARSPVQISFYGGNFLGQPEKTVRRLLDIAAEFIKPGPVDTIRFSTRPDTIDATRLGWLSDYPVATIELGAQSMRDSVLRAANRGHTARDTQAAMALLHERPYETGLQMMIGLPGDDAAGALETGRRIAALEPDFVRIYPTVVLKGSDLAEQFLADGYKPPPLELAVELSGRLYRLFVNRDIRVVRMGLQAARALCPEDALLAGPYHPAFGQLVFSYLFFESVCRALRETDKQEHHISIAVHPRSVSNLRGQKNSNIAALKKLFAVDTVTVLSRPGLDENYFAVNDSAPQSILTERD